jgi:hypothetical protein
MLGAAAAYSVATSAQVINAVNSSVVFAVASRVFLLSLGIARAITSWLKTIWGMTNSNIHPYTAGFICNKISDDTDILTIAIAV